MNMHFTGLPNLPAIAELQSRPQWVAWKFEYRNGPDKKPTKPPVSPKSGFGASHSNPSTWGTYQEAMQIAARRNLPGVGYVISPDDDYTGIDLDDCIGPDGDLEPWAAEIVSLGETYCEVSPSGNGLRLIARGKVDRTVKCDQASVEIYRDRRYLTITGTHYPGTPQDIRPAPKTIERLIARIEQFRPADQSYAGPTVGTESSIPPSKSSGTSEFFSNVNSKALASLASWVPAIFPSARHQPGTGAFRVSSKALGRNLQEDLSLAPDGIVDFGIHDMGDAREGKRTAIDICIEYGGQRDAKEAAFWLCDRIGVSPKAMGWDEYHVSDPIEAAAAARRLIENYDGSLTDAETGEVVEAVEVGAPAATTIPFPPGLVGDIARWITATARRPQPELAIGAALTIVGTACGRHIQGPTKAGTALYTLALAPTGKGKETPLKACVRVLAASGMSQHVGPDQWMSMSALVQMVVRKPLALCAQDEFGSFMQRVFNKKGSTHERAIPQILRALWGVNFGPWTTPQWANGTEHLIDGPCLSIYATSTHEQFYSAMAGAAVADGTLNRFLIIEGRKKPGYQQPLAEANVVPDEISAAMRELYNRSGPLSASQRNQPDYNLATTGGLITLQWCPDGAEAIFEAFRAEMDREADEKPLTADFIVRAPEMAVRIATIVAAGRGNDNVRRDDVEFGIQLVRHSMAHMLAGAEEYMTENEHEANVKRVLRLVRSSGRISHRELLRQVRSIRTRDLKDIVASLIAEESIAVDEVETKGRKRIDYVPIY